MINYEFVECVHILQILLDPTKSNTGSDNLIDTVITCRSEAMKISLYLLIKAAVLGLILICDGSISVVRFLN